MSEAGHRILIFGNSASGKSTLARELQQHLGIAHLDLDGLAWLPEKPPRRAPLDQSAAAIDAFTAKHSEWVIEGCYADLLELLTPVANRVIFMNPGTEACVANARARPWEPHKYASAAEQDANLDMLIEWIGQYDRRQDEFSMRAHRDLFSAFDGLKTEIDSNQRSFAAGIESRS